MLSERPLVAGKSCLKHKCVCVYTFLVEYWMSERSEFLNWRFWHGIACTLTHSWKKWMLSCHCFGMPNCAHFFAQLQILLTRVSIIQWVLWLISGLNYATNRLSICTNARKLLCPLFIVSVKTHQFGQLSHLPLAHWDAIKAPVFCACGGGKPGWGRRRQARQEAKLKLK